MPDDASHLCPVCGKPGDIHMTEINAGVRTHRSYCPAHVPPELARRMKLPQTPAEEIAFLRSKLAEIDQRQDVDSATREMARAETEQLIAQIERGERRLFE